MNLRKVQKSLKSALNDKRNLNFEYDFKTDNSNEEYLHITSSVTHSSYKGEIFVTCDFYESGLICHSFIFDKIDLNDSVKALINEFNKVSVWLTAYVNDNGYLALRNNIFTGEEQASVENINLLLDHLVSGKIINKLQPIVNLTYSN